MPATRTSSKPAEITPAERRNEIIAILAAGLVRLIQAGQAPASMPTDALAGTPGEKLSESAEIGLELLRETRLSVTAG